MHRTEWDEVPREELEAAERETRTARDAISRERFGGGGDGEAAARRRAEERRLDVRLHEIRQALKRRDRDEREAG